jgi:hypothetical protein
MGTAGDHAHFAHDAEEMVRNTPSAAELKKLFEREDGETQPGEP